MSTCKPCPLARERPHLAFKLTGACCVLNLLGIAATIALHFVYWPTLPLNVSYAVTVFFGVVAVFLAAGNLLIAAHRDRVGPGSPSCFPMACGLAAGFAAAHYFTSHPKLSGAVALVVAETVQAILMLAMLRLLHAAHRDPTHQSSPCGTEGDREGAL